MSDETNKKIEAPDEHELLDDPKELLLKCEAERDEYLNSWKRAKADLINYQNDEAKRVGQTVRMSSEKILSELLPVLESFELGLRAKDDADGLQNVFEQLKDTLSRLGLEAISVQAGQPFDPHIHESVGEVVSEHSSGTIAEEVRKGYTFNGRTLKPSQVRLSQ